MTQKTVRLGVAELDPHGGGERVAHGAHAPGVEEAPGLGVVEPERRPDLVVADVGDHDRLVVAARVHLLQHLLGLQEALALDVVDGVLLPPLVDLGQPLVLALGLHHGEELAERGLGVGDHRDVGDHALADLGGVDVDVDEVLDAGRERVQPGGDPVVAAHPDHHQHVRVADRLVGVAGAHEADHLERHRVLERERPGAEQGPADRDVGAVGQLQHLLLGAGDEHAPRPSSITGRFASLMSSAMRASLAGSGSGGRREGAEPHRLLGVVELGDRRLEVLGEVDDHRAGAAGAGDVEGLLDGGGDVLDPGHQVGVLDHRHGRADDVATPGSCRCRSRRPATWPVMATTGTESA